MPLQNVGMPPGQGRTPPISTLRKRILIVLTATRSVKSKLKFLDYEARTYFFRYLVAFLEKLGTFPPLPSSLVSHLGSLYRLSSTSNAEIRLRFYTVALSDPTSSAARTYAGEAANWVIGEDGSGVIKGRMKFCRPIFRLIFKVDQDLAVQKFQKAKNFFHPIARKLIEKVCNRD